MPSIDLVNAVSIYPIFTKDSKDKVESYALFECHSERAMHNFHLKDASLSYKSPCYNYSFSEKFLPNFLLGHKITPLNVVSKEIQIILSLFLVIAMYCQVSSSQFNESLNLPRC